MPLIPGLIFLLSGSIIFSGIVTYDLNKQICECKNEKKFKLIG